MIKFLNAVVMLLGKMLFLLSSIIGFCFILLIVFFVVSFFYVGSPKSYFINEVGMYIKTFPSRKYVTIVFSDEEINDFSDKSDYIIIRRGNDYLTSLLLYPNNKNVIYNCGSNSILYTKMSKYQFDTIIYEDTICLEYQKGERGYLLKPPCLKLLFEVYGSKEELFLKTRNDIGYTKVKPINN